MRKRNWLLLKISFWKKHNVFYVIFKIENCITKNSAKNNKNRDITQLFDMNLHLDRRQPRSAYDVIKSIRLHNSGKNKKITDTCVTKTILHKSTCG